MLIAIPATEQTLTSEIASRFARAKYFIIYDPSNETFQALENSQDLFNAQGAGIQAAQIVLDSNAKVLITYNCGPKAVALLQRGQIEVFVTDTPTVTVEAAIALYLANKLKLLTAANVSSHW